MQNTEIRFYEFGEFRLDARRRVLTKNSQPIQVQNRHLELLLVLVANEGRILSQDELIDKVWDGAFIEQSNLKKGISALRHILEESPTDGEFIKTIPRKGYSFIAPVRTFTDDSTAAGAPEQRINVSTDSTALNQSGSLFRSKYLFALILILLLAVTFFGWRFWHPSVPADLTRGMQIEPLTSLGNANSGEISRNGEHLLFGVIKDGLYSIWLKHLPTGKITPLLKPQKARIYAASFTPNGDAIYLWLSYEAEPQRNGVYKIGLTESEPQKISDKNTGVDFSPDGGRIAYRLQNINEKGENGLFTANPDFSNEKLIFSYNPSELVIQSHDWSPDGSFITYVARSIKNNQKKYFIAQIPATGGAEQFIVPPRSESIFSAVWFPDGNGLAVTAPDSNTQIQQIWYLSYPAGQWQRITNDFTGYSYAQVTADGKGIVVSQQRDIFNLWIGQSDGQNFRQITFDTIRYEVECGWLDEETILFSANEGGNYDIWALAADGTNRRQLTFDPHNDLNPRAAPDGKRIFFLSNRSGMRQVWQMDADGASPRQITNSAVEVRDFKILSDGQTLIYEVWLPAQETVLFKKMIDGGSEIKQLPFPAPYQWDVSSDGKLLAYAARTDSGMKVRISPLEENKLLKEFDLGDFDKLAWTKDSKGLLYDSNKGSGEIMFQPIEGTAPPRQLTNFNANENIWNFDVSPNGKHIVARRVRQYFDLMLIKLNPN